MDPSHYATNNPNLIFDQLERERRLASDEYSKERNRALFRDTSARLATLTPAAQDGPSDVVSDMHRYLNKFTDEDGVRWSNEKASWVASPPFFPNARLNIEAPPRRYVTIKTPFFDAPTENALAALAGAGVSLRHGARVYNDDPPRYLSPRFNNVTGELLGGFFMVDAEEVENA